jgi:type IV secretory pathway TrbL component
MGEFLYTGHQKYIGMAMIVLSVLIVVLLMLRKKPFDERHAGLLTKSLAVAGLISVCLVALFLLLIFIIACRTN